MYANVPTENIGDVEIRSVALAGRSVPLIVDHDSLENGMTPRSFHALPLILGFGNVLLSDDGTGVQLVAQLRSMLGPDAAEFIDAGTTSFSLLAYIEATEFMLVLDAGELGRAPGSLELFEDAAMDDFLRSSRRRTVHEVGLIDLLDTARLLDTIPTRRALLCIQPAEIGWGETLSRPVRIALPDAMRQACALLERWKST